MNKRTAVAGVVIAVAVLALMSSAMLSYDWYQDDGPQSIPFAPDADGELVEGALNYKLFEVYGPVILVLAMVMFGAIIGGAYVAKEEDDEDDPN